MNGKPALLLNFNPHNYENMKTKLRLILRLSTIVLLMTFPLQSAFAQLQFCGNLSPVLGGYSSGDLFLVKYGISDGPFAFRIGFGGSNNASSQGLATFANSVYTNMNLWPSDIEKISNRNNSKSMNVNVGLEFRKTLGSNMVYAGLDLGTGSSNYSYEYVYFYAPSTAPNQYTIYYVQKSSSQNESKYYGADIMLGYQRSLGNGFALMAELSLLSQMWHSNSYTYDPSITYSWDDVNSKFVLEPAGPIQEIEETPMNTSLNWNPTLGLFLTYTLGSAN